MALITFTKVGLVYEAEFEVEKDFTLHIERPRYGMLRMYQRGTDGKYALVEDLKDQKHKLVMDYECQVLVPKKWIKVVTEVFPTYAEVVSSGEVTEIKSQSKEVEVTANGTTAVTPDAGYSYLSGVTVKVNVPQEGGGGSESTMEYLDVRNLAQNKQELIVSAAMLVKIEGGFIMASGIMAELGSAGRDMVEAIATIPSMLLKMPDMDNVITIGELIADFSSIPRLTEEEFYTIETA